MKELEERIREQGTVKPGDVLKVDAFLNHQCDVELFDHMGAAWAEHFQDKTITKILTIEASGIGIACVAAQHCVIRQVPWWRASASPWRRVSKVVATSSARKAMTSIRWRSWNRWIPRPVPLHSAHSRFDSHDCTAQRSFMN